MVSCMHFVKALYSEDRRGSHTPLVSILAKPSHNSDTDLTVPLHFQFPPTKKVRFAAAGAGAAMMSTAYFLRLLHSNHTPFSVDIFLFTILPG